VKVKTLADSAAVLVVALAGVSLAAAFVWNFVGLMNLVYPVTGRLSALFPLTVDVVMLAATLTLVVLRNESRPGTKAFVWAVLLTFLGLSFFGMHEHAAAQTTDRVLPWFMAVPSVTAAVAVELVLLVLTWRERLADAALPAASTPTPVVTVPSQVAPTVPVSTPARVPSTPSPHRPAPRLTAVKTPPPAAASKRGVTVPPAQIEAALRSHSGSVTAAADALGCSPKTVKRYVDARSARSGAEGIG